MIGHGVSSRSSHSCAAGRTTCSAKPWTQSRRSRWSSERSSEKADATAGASGCCSLVLASTDVLSAALEQAAQAIGIGLGRFGGVDEVLEQLGEAAGLAQVGEVARAVEDLEAAAGHL